MENLNSCCFISTVDEIRPIEGADKIELALVKGWSCIVKKGSHSVGDLVVCATTDAVIPESISTDLNVKDYLRSGTRVKTIKLKGVYSECLIMPMSVLQGKLTMGHSEKDGMDVMEILGIHKYEPPAKMVQLSSGRKVRYFENQNFRIYYKFPNIKNVKGMFTEEDTVQITRKIHGTNARYGIVKKTRVSWMDSAKKFIRRNFRLFSLESWDWVDYEFVIGSHNVEKGSDSQGFYDTNVWFEIEKKYGIKERLWNYVKNDLVFPYGIGSGVILYGEIYGHGIQKNYDYGLKDKDFVAFDVEENGEYLTTSMTKSVVELILGLPHVEVLYYGKWSQEVQDSYVFKNFVEGTKVPHEGVVVKSSDGSRNKVAKVINPDYLIFSEKNHVGDSH